jgi:hypothetical protein
MKPVSKSERSKLVEECFKGRILESPSQTRCEKMEKTEDFCTVYPFPAMMWRNGGYCPMATHSQVLAETKAEKVRVGQQKQKKKI